jgi:NTE family protein
VHTPGVAARHAHGPAWSKLLAGAAFEEVEAGRTLRTVGEEVVELLVIDRGLVEVECPGQPPRWGGPGAVLGAKEALRGDPASASVTAIRYGRVARIPIAAIRGEGGGTMAPFPAADQPWAPDEEALVDLPPDPLVIAAVLEGLDAEREERIAELLQQAVSSLVAGKLVRVTSSGDATTLALADELASNEEGAATVVYLIGASAGPRGAAVTAHADRVLLIQPIITSGAASPARDVACDGAPRRHTEVVYVVNPGTSSSDTTRRMRVPAHTRRTHILPELSATRLELLLADVRQGAREHEALRLFEIFRELTPAELAWMQRTLRWERIDGGNLLVRQGEAADALWLVRAGRLEAQRDTPAGPRHAAWLGPGQVVGEAAVLAETAHNETVRAVRDSTVARVDRDAVAALLARSHGFARVMARVVARASAVRVLGDMAPGARLGRTIAVIPVTSPERVAQFAAALARQMERAGARTAVVDAARLDSELGAGASRTRRGDVGDAEIIAWLARLEEQHDTVLLVCGAEADSWMRRAMRQGDKLLFVADSTAPPALRPFERAEETASSDALTSHHLPHTDSPSHEGERHLVLLQRAGITEAAGTMAWLAERTVHAHHHVRDDSADDLARVARRLTGRAVALAFSGAASRAPAHFGVVRAMRELGLPIDVMSGSSSGAGVAALIAMGFPYDEALAHALSIIKKGIPTLRQFHPPITALTSGREAGEVLQDVYGERLLEDQLVPVIITAVDIRRHRLVLLTRGPIWKLLRASGSLPLLWPPVWHEDDLLVDGAIVNYLPIDVFGDEAALGLTVGSNLEISSSRGGLAFERSLRYGTHISGWRVLFQRLLGKKVRPPRLVEILYHAMAIPSFQQQEAFRRVAPTQRLVIVTPPLGQFGLFGADATVGQRLEREAAEYARGVLEGVPTSHIPR